MTKFIEIELDGQIDRYKLIDISTDDFIDIILKDRISKITDLTEQEFENHPARQHYIPLNVDDRFQVIHYIVKHLSEDDEKEWIELCNEIKML